MSLLRNLIRIILISFLVNFYSCKTVVNLDNEEVRANREMVKMFLNNTDVLREKQYRKKYDNIETLDWMINIIKENHFNKNSRIVECKIYQNYYNPEFKDRMTNFIIVENDNTKIKIAFSFDKHKNDKIWKFEGFYLDFPEDDSKEANQYDIP